MEKGRGYPTAGPFRMLAFVFVNIDQTIPTTSSDCSQLAENPLNSTKTSHPRPVAA
jgi:hypothetical protein